MQTAIVIVAVALAAAYLGARIWRAATAARRAKNEAGCGAACGCGEGQRPVLGAGCSRFFAGMRAPRKMKSNKRQGRLFPFALLAARGGETIRRRARV